MKTTFAAFALVSNISAVKIDRQARANPDGYTFNNGVLSASILKTHTDAETARAAAVAAQKAADVWRAGSTPNSGPVINYAQMQNPADYDTYATTNNKLADALKEQQDKYYARVLWGNQQEEEYNAWRGVEWTPTKKDLGLESLVQGQAIPDGYTFNNGVLSASILDTHTNAETARAASVAKQQAADAWRNGWTDNTGAVTHPYGLVQHRANPDGYTFNNGVLSASILKTHTEAEAARAAAVAAQKAADAWRNGFTANSGPVINYSQMEDPANHDNYATTFGKLNDELKEKSDKYTARVAWGNQQEEEANAWRGIAWTPTKEDLGLKAMQRGAIPDGYTFNNGVLSDSIKKAHTDAETARAAAVASQQKSDVWRAGATPNSGPVIVYAQNPADHDNYATNMGKEMDGLTAWQTKYQKKLDQGKSDQVIMDAWRSVPHVTKDSEWQGVASLAQGQPSPSPTDYGFSFKTMNDKTNTHNDLWWAEQNADVAKQTAVDAWRNGYTANTGPELPYTM